MTSCPCHTTGRWLLARLELFLYWSLSLIPPLRVLVGYIQLLAVASFRCFISQLNREMAVWREGVSACKTAIETNMRGPSIIGMDLRPRQQSSM